jgi:hypothetical protein
VLVAAFGRPSIPEIRPSTSANFRERRTAKFVLAPGPIGQGFSGSCGVTSRNGLIQKAETNATWSPCFDADNVAPCRCRVLGAALDGSLATPNFRELCLPEVRLGGPVLSWLPALRPGLHVRYLDALLVEIYLPSRMTNSTLAVPLHPSLMRACDTPCKL